jgi:hypothetical protein
MVEEDVLEVGQVVGATFESVKTNMFSVLSKARYGKRDTPKVAEGGEVLRAQGC